jgi:hypothetical protein
LHIEATKRCHRRPFAWRVHRSLAAALARVHSGCEVLKQHGIGKHTVEAMRGQFEGVALALSPGARALRDFLSRVFSFLAIRF